MIKQIFFARAMGLVKTRDEEIPNRLAVVDGFQKKPSYNNKDFMSLKC